MNYGFIIDNRRCIGCHACSTACKSENNVPLGVFRSHEPVAVEMTNVFHPDGRASQYPPPERWDDWTEYDGKAWPRRVPRNYSLVPTICFNCESACGLLAYVDKETFEIKKFEGNPVHPGSRGRNCAKGPATHNQTYDPERILHPLKRVGARGEGTWERVSWDEVLTDIALADLDQNGREHRLSIIAEGRAWESCDPDTSRIWWKDVGVHQNLTHAVHPDPVSGAHCWLQRAISVRKAKPGERHGDVSVDTAKSMAVYREWLALARSAEDHSPDETRRPYWLKRPLKPTRESYKLRPKTDD